MIYMTTVEGEMFARKVKIIELEQRIERLEKKMELVIGLIEERK